jgi:hypothetical protein
MDANGSFPGKRGLGHNADHSQPCSKIFKNEWNYTSAPPCAFMTCTSATLLTVTFYIEEYTSSTKALCGQR